MHLSDLDFAASVQVLTLGQILRFDVDTSVTERMRLESLAAMSLTYRFIEGTNIPQDLRYYESKEYKACFLYEHIFGCSTKTCCNCSPTSHVCGAVVSHCSVSMYFTYH